jgi:GNAT superfamily N-acetyltransferase
MISIGKLVTHPEHLDTAAQWAYRNWYEDKKIPYRAVLNDFRKRMNDNALPLTFLALQGDLPVGMISLKKTDLLSRRDLCPWLSSLYVIPECRGRGIARSLIGAVQAEAARLGFHEIFLFADHRDAFRLCNYYHRLGWCEFSEAEDISGNTVKVFRTKLEK